MFTSVRIIILSFPTFLAVGNSPCFEADADGFLSFADSLVCLDKRCYIVSKQERSWLDAHQCCAGIGGNLATFDSESLIREAFLSTYVNRGNIRYLWIGAHNQEWTSAAGAPCIQYLQDLRIIV